MKYDLVVFGGGTSGISAAYISAKHGLKTLLVERTDVLGGSITQGLVVPSMKVNAEGINTDFFNDLKLFADKYKARHTYTDGNEGWFNPELLKIVFDEMINSVKCQVILNSQPNKINYKSHFECYLLHKLLSIYIETKYIIDATSEGEIFKLLNCNFQKKSDNRQAPSLRFMLSGIDINCFADWIEKIDTNRDVTTVERTKEQIYLSTACTWDRDKNWALTPIMDKAVRSGILEYEDTAYFQVFSVPSMPDSLNFNAPRIILKEDEDIQDPFVYSRAVMQGRQRVYRLYNFCKNYLPGFENSYISHISDVLGIRESNRVKCKYTVTKEDIINPKEFDNIALACDYPIDIHSNNKNEDVLNFTKKTYYVPIEALISEKYDNLYAAGRIISSDFEAQAALRTQLTCFSMGEAASKDIIKKLK
ncbi:MAG: FAD-dependent oxidoreductase [Candidatus Gastranaerophilales bacterium]|nr:FAD-dependent oxidoreductase [Candidatus Gastranaerophilales bacterium]